jgi:hypothetical protein
VAKRSSGTPRVGGLAGSGRGADTARNAASPRTSGDCVYAGQEYSEGAIIEQGGVQQRCVNGKWQVVDPAHRGRGGLPTNG